MSTPLPRYNPMVASARVVMPNRKLTFQYENWQDQLWDYYDRLGEFESAVAWKANSMSRVRLLAAELSVGGEEPTPLESGPAVEAMERFAGGTGGQAQLMREITVHDSVVGEGWIVGEADSDFGERWYVASADELRVSSRGTGFELREGEDERKSWRPLPPDTIVIRVWNPHPRYGWRADSDARHAMGAMLELDLVNKRIVAEITSRLASNGILLYDKEKLSFGSTHQPPDGADQVDPFAQILVDVASQAMKDAVSPEAVIPIPIGFALGDLTNVDPKTLMQHIKFSEGMDEKLLSERESAVKRMATSLDMPAEMLLGIGGMNHWGAWQVEESGIKIHIAPTAERFTFGITNGYLRPFLKAAGEPLVGPNGRPVVVWYDPSEITVRPDLSTNAIAAYDRNEVSGDTLRREIGLSDADAPTIQEQKEWMLKFMGRQAQLVPTALAALEGRPAPEPVPSENSEPEPAPVPEGENTEPDQPQSDDIPVENMSYDQLVNLAIRVDQEFGVRRGPASPWVEAEEPMDLRTTPKRREAPIQI